MSKQKENSVDNEIIYTSKTEKIDFRLSAKMKEMLQITASDKKVKMSQLLNHIVEKFFEEQAKIERLAMEEKRVQESLAKKEYALLDKKMKHQKGDFQADETSPQSPVSNEKDDAFSKFILWLFLMASIYFGWKYLQKRNEKKQKLLQHQWQFQKNQHHLKGEPTPSDNPSDNSVGHQ